MWGCLLKDMRLSSGSPLVYLGLHPVPLAAVAAHDLERYGSCPCRGLQELLVQLAAIIRLTGALEECGYAVVSAGKAAEGDICGHACMCSE